MGAFKAANPGCTIGDFVRWHSPRDWDEKKGQMSARMADSGNFWQELWEVSNISQCFLVVDTGVDKWMCFDPMLLYLQLYRKLKRSRPASKSRCSTTTTRQRRPCPI